MSSNKPEEITLGQLKQQHQQSQVVAQEFQQLDDPKEIYEKLKAKWDLKETQTMLQSEVPIKSIEQLIEESKARKVPKFMQIDNQYKQQISDNMTSKGELHQDGPMPQMLQSTQENFQGRKGVINIGQQWSDIIENSARRKYRDQAQAYHNFFWLQAKRGKLGVDGLAIVFGVVGIFMVPLYFYRKTQLRQQNYKEEIKVITKVKDWETSTLDIDDVSVQRTDYNLFTEEFRKIINKKIEIATEINKLLGR